MGVAWISGKVPGFRVDYAGDRYDPAEFDAVEVATNADAPEDAKADKECGAHPKATVRYSSAVVDGCPLCAFDFKAASDGEPKAFEPVKVIDDEADDDPAPKGRGRRG